MSKLIGSLAQAAMMAAIGSAPGFAAEAKTKSRPNVLFIAVDDLRPEFGAYGKAYVKTPNIDALAASGTTLDRAYCQQAVCSPSRSSIMTGMRPDSTKVYDLVTHFRAAFPDVVTLPQLFKENGYFVRGMGKIYHPGYEDERSWSVPWETAPAPIYGTKENQAIRQERAEQLKASGKAGNGARVAAYESADVPDETFPDGKIAIKAVKALGEMKKGETFSLAVGFARPHLPFVAPKKSWNFYDPATISLAAHPFRPKGAPEYAMVDSGELRNYHGIPKMGNISDDLARTLKHGYYAAISYMDAQVGKVLGELDRLGLRENTIVVLWGDHGWKLGEHGACCNAAFERRTGHSRPLILSAPGVSKPGSHSKALVEFVDVYPTLADLAGLASPKGLEGISFAPVIREPGCDWKTAASSQYPRPNGLMGDSMRTDRYRLTRRVRKDDPSKVEAVELYDHQTDTDENQIVANDPDRAEVLKDLTERWQHGWKGALPAAASPPR